MRSSKVLVVLSFLCTGSVLNGQRCPNQETGVYSGAETYDSVRYGHYIELDCCSRNGGSISWMKFSKSTSQWQNYTPDRDDVLLLESNQILAIQSAIFEDTGSYKCQEQNGSVSTVLKAFALNVIACDKLARGAYPVSPLPCPETVAREKETLTLPCTGYFGCSEEGDIRIAMWYVSTDANDDWREISEEDKRYTETKFKEDTGTIVGSNLTIKDVSGVDFNRKFMCLLATAQAVKGQSSIVVTLKKTAKTGEDSLLLSGFDSGDVIIGLSVFTVLLFITTVVSIGLCVQKKVSKKRRAIRRSGEGQWFTMNYKDNKALQQMLP